MCHHDTNNYYKGEIIMKLWLEGNQRCCYRETAIELGGSEYRNPDIKTILHFDEFISIRDNDEVCHRDTPVEKE